MIAFPCSSCGQRLKGKGNREHEQERHSGTKRDTRHTSPGTRNGPGVATALTLLKGLGLLTGEPLTIGSDDPEDLRIAAKERQFNQTLRACL